MDIPAISVIVPLYNAEKYIGECLDSILVQTFRDFEVIVVDDCSTDNSVVVVDSYIPKFDGRLMLTSTIKNSGNAGYTARNKGFTFSRGEYVFFVDADDFITKTALEELYTAAKKYDADVVYTGTRYHYTNNETNLRLDGIAWLSKEQGIEDKPTLTINNPHKNIEGLFCKSFFWVPWTKFVRRDFLIKEEIKFFELPSSGDFGWTIELLCCAKRFLRIPNAVYFWRDDSVISTTRKQRETNKQITFWYSVIISMINSLKILSVKHKILKDNPSYVYIALNLLFNENFNRIIKIRFQVSSEDIFDILQRELENDADFSLAIPFFFSVIDAQQKNLLINQQKSTQYVEQTQARIAELEQLDKFNKAYISELENFIAQSQEHIDELENEIKRLNSRE